MSDGKDTRPEEREPEGSRPSDAAAAPEPGDDSVTGDGVEASGAGEGSGSAARFGSGAGSGAAPGSGAESAERPAPGPVSGPARLRALVTPHEQEPKYTHAGNGTVNHGLDEQSPEGLDADELELRTLLHQVVREVEPTDGTLDYLRRAVPARRARKRQALVGAAAAALFLGTAVPALVHVSTTTGSDANPSAVGHASQAQGGTGEGKGPDGGESTAGGSSDQVEGSDKGDKKDEDKGDGGGNTGSGTGATEGAAPSAGTAAGVPACTAAQLGPAAVSSAAPDSTGAVYGSFRVTNVSTTSCGVDGAGLVSATPQGAADGTRVGSARHVAGDAAAGLPDPSLEAARLVLEPGSAYEVKWAWVPSETCPAPGGDSGGTGGPSPDPSPTENPTTTSGSSAGTGTGTGTDSGMTTQLVLEDGTTDGSVAVTYTASTGSSSATTTVSNACAGTVYWTGLLSAM
ncbi:hypothetical protein [Streptomyces capillispiralis]|uniref:DUF4232 domain-containing protein n=1 Tax=Streptomyces capillispiralis TaxID=68182 RepID=A0A561TGH8_9ACTN|nr:hypothetical protein [Streptomyces capillispiralis]TWF86214.1 hypothetical protein FHX78_113178 [Streptomyces capillispiralis]GHH91136.1 hypothetical protein GCM10017779_15930 [Streptomyces capillispiralis]